MEKERRQFRRLQKPVSARHRRGSQDPVEATLAQDVCTGGMRLTSNVPMQEGTELTTEVFIPGTPQPFYAFSKVIWCRESQGKNHGHKYEIGIQFVRVVSKARISGF
ncbi:MAG: PilZ domain-containing protein [Candidatus Omnitrophica bacterium]|nr:PilZ domain-containing protein [Candidatus Omnitrophota bacterium]